MSDQHKMSPIYGVLLELVGLRRNGLTERQLKSWISELEEWPADTISKVGRKMAREWDQAWDWGLPDIVRRLPVVAAKEPLDCFAWCSITGAARGNWAKFDRLDEDQRLAIALHLLESATEARWHLHQETALRMHPMAIEMYRARRGGNGVPESQEA